MSRGDRDVAPPLRSDENLELETLGTMLVDPAAARDGCERLSGDEFKAPGHRAIFRAVRAELAAGGTLDLMAIGQRIEANGRDRDDVLALEPAGVPLYLVRLAGFQVAAANIPKRCNRLIELDTLRQVAAETERAAQAAREPGADPAEVLEALGATIECLKAQAGGGADELARLALAGPEFMAQQLPEPKSLLWPSLLCEGGGAILHAPAGAGKSFLAEQLAHAVATGEPWLGKFATPEGGVPVVLIQAELSSYHLQQRRRGHPAYRSGPAKLHTLTFQQLGHQLDILTPSDRNKLIRIVRDKGSRLLILDPLAQFHSEAESPEGFGKVRRAVTDLTLRAGCAVLLVHHEAKTTADQAGGRGKASADRVRGAGILARDWSELQMGLEADPAGHHRLTFHKVRHAQEPAPVYLKRDDAGWWEPTEAPVLVGDKTTAALERALLAATLDEGLSKSELVAASVRDGGAKTDRAINDALDRLARGWGLEDRQALNIGTPHRPRYAWKGGSQETSGSQTDFQLENNCGATDSELDKF